MKMCNICSVSLSVEKIVWMIGLGMKEDERHKFDDMESNFLSGMFSVTKIDTVWILELNRSIGVREKLSHINWTESIYRWLNM